MCRSFKGKGIGVDADIASLDFRETSLRTLKHLQGGYRVPSRFKERVGEHLCCVASRGRQGEGKGKGGGERRGRGASS